MITRDQPTIFADSFLCAFSARADGTMLIRSQGRHAAEAVANRRAFLQSLGVDYPAVVYQVISYADGATYRTYTLVDGRASLAHEPHGIVADALITNTPGIALFLPVADCVATALYDPITKTAASLHLGRHNTVTDLVARVVGAMQRDFGAQPADIRAWLSPSVQQASYPMQYFDQMDEPAWQPFLDRRETGIHLDLAGYNRARLLAAGLSAEHIEVSAVDTAASDAYFCHSRGDTEGRMAMVAMIRQGEPAIH